MPSDHSITEYLVAVSTDAAQVPAAHHRQLADRGWHWALDTFTDSGRLTLRMTMRLAGLDASTFEVWVGGDSTTELATTFHTTRP